MFRSQRRSASDQTTSVVRRSSRSGEHNPLWHRLTVRSGSRLRIGDAQSAQEKEADQTADRVMRMKSDDTLHRQPAVAPVQIQREAQPDEEVQAAPEDEVQRQGDEEEEQVQTKRGGSGVSGRMSPCTARQIRCLRGRGQPLSPGLRRYFEPRFGRGLSQVRIHTGREASSTATAIRARAYTLGADVVFAPGQYQPDSSRGRRLLAHELTHVIQQGRAD